MSLVATSRQGDHTAQLHAARKAIWIQCSPQGDLDINGAGAHSGSQRGLPQLNGRGASRGFDSLAGARAPQKFTDRMLFRQRRTAAQPYLRNQIRRGQHPLAAHGYWF